MIKETNKTPLVPYDIISDPKTVVALSLLYNSMVSLLPSRRTSPRAKLTCV
jgi:hypothetical protein